MRGQTTRPRLRGRLHDQSEVAGSPAAINRCGEKPSKYHYQDLSGISMATVNVLTTPRLIMREMIGDDLDHFAALFGDEHVMRYYPRPRTRSEAQTWIDWNQRLYREHGFGVWAVILRATGEFVGDCGLTPLRLGGVDEIEVGYHVRASLEGNGYGSEAASAARDFARDRLGLHRLIAIINPANLPSQRVAAKIGLAAEKTVTVLGEEQVIYAGEI
jgi:RimJ/RimL family protein N-acetyltransferase